MNIENSNQINAADQMNTADAVKCMKQSMWFKLLGLPSLIYGVFFTLCMHDNYAGITMPVWVAGTIVYVYYLVNKAEARWNKSCSMVAGAMLLFGISTCITGNVMVILGNYFAFFTLLLLLLIMLTSSKIEWKITHLTERMICAVAGAVVKCAAPVAEAMSWLQIGKKSTSKKGREITIGVLAAIPAVFIIGFLLANADAVFGNVLGKVADSVSIPQNVIEIILMLVFGVFSSYCGMHYFMEDTQEIHSTKKKRKPATIAVTFSIAILCLYVVFCGIQVIYLFGAFGTLPNGMSYAAYARQGFFQLLFVVFLNLVFVIIIRNLFEERRLLNGLLIAISLCTYIMCASSCYRMILYIQAYRLTVLRVMVLISLAVIAILLTGVDCWIMNQKFPVCQFGLCVVVTAGLIVSLSHVDYWVARYDYAYGLADEKTMQYITSLSVDAAPVIADYMEEHPAVAEEVSKMMNSERWKTGYNGVQTDAYYVLNFIDAYTAGMKNRSIRKWNWSYWNAGKIFAK